MTPSHSSPSLHLYIPITHAQHPPRAPCAHPQKLQGVSRADKLHSEVVGQCLREDVRPGHAGQAADSPPGRKLLPATRGLPHPIHTST